jgi:hypothetical protein
MPLVMIAMQPEEYRELRAKLPAVTAENIRSVYGVSETTWRKIRKGVPVRRETLERIRLRSLQLA